MNRIHLSLFYVLISGFPCISVAETALPPASVEKHSFERNMVLYSPARHEYTFDYQDENELIEYSIRANDPFVEQGMLSLRVRVNSERTLIPLKTGGLMIRTASGQIHPPTQVSASGICRFVTHFLEQGSARFSYEETLGDNLLYKDFSVSIQGKTLILQASSHSVANATTGYIGFDFSDSQYTPSAKILQFPSSPVPVVHTFNNVYLSTYVDPFLSTTARYEDTRLILNRRNAQISNTPAWLIEGDFGTLPKLDVTAYITVSSDWKDVIPRMPTVDDPSRWKPSFVLDMEELPLAQRPYLPLEIIREWTAPDAGKVKLNGAVSIQGKGQNLFEVHIQRANREEPIVMYSQLLDPVHKPVAGLKGEFPVEAGDRLLFISASPAVMDGGLLSFNIGFELNGKRYSTQSDFLSEQGAKGWVYRQKRGAFSSLLLWNPQTRSWESPDTRSWISKNGMAVRRGAKGDAFTAADVFLQELHALGIQRYTLIPRRWDQHAALALSSPDESSVRRWGTMASLQRITQRERQRGNQIIPHVALETLKQRFKPFAFTQFASHLLTLKKPSASQFIQMMQDAVQQHIQKLDSAISYDALLIEGFPHPEGLYRHAGTLQWLSGQDRNRSFYEWIDRLLVPVVRSLPTPLIWQGDFFSDPRHWFWSGYASAVMTPRHSRSSVGLLIDSEIDQADRLTRIGFGSIADFFQTDPQQQYVNAEMNSNDVYLSALVAESRVPYFSDRYTHTRWNSRDTRKWLLESYALTAPLADEYLAASNPVQSIRYTASDGDIVSATDILAADPPVFPERIEIHYQNGLKTYINRSGSDWRVPQSFLPDMRVLPDGFFAVNEKTGLIALMGASGNSRFTAAKTPDSFFLHSRDGGMMNVSPILTDGMVYIRNAEELGRQHLTALGVSEVRRTGLLNPVLRASKKADIALSWMTPDSAQLWVFDNQSEPFLLELYELPPHWFNDDGRHLHISRRREQQTQSQTETAWSIVQNREENGIRLPAAQGGIIYQIQYRVTPLQTSMVEQRKEAR